MEERKKVRKFASRIVNVMKSRQEYIDIIKEHASELQKKYGITSLSLFGSVARNEHHEGSDIDIYVTMPAKMFNYVMAAQYLEKILLVLNILMNLKMITYLKLYLIFFLYLIF